MTKYYIRGEDDERLGPYEPEAIRGWIDEGRLDDQTEFSGDGAIWRYARDLPDLGGTAGAIVQPEGTFPEPSLLIRQGANIQGPYLMSRIRGYVEQRRIQHYMLFSQDGVFWIGPEHVPGLLPRGYAPLPPPGRPTAVPVNGARAADTSVAVMPQGTPPPAPGEDIGSSTLVGFRLDEDEGAPLAAPTAPPKRVPPHKPGSPPLREEVVESAPGPVLYHVRTGGQDVYGPCSEEVMKTWIAEGRVDASAEFSTDGRTWSPGFTMDALFGAAPSQRAPTAPAPRRRRGR